MKLTIIKDDNAVYKDGLCLDGLPLTTIPSDVHALQWKDSTGWIEYVDQIKPNESIVQLPSWATAALAEWQNKYDAIQAAQSAAQAAAKANVNP